MSRNVLYAVFSDNGVFVCLSFLVQVSFLRPRNPNGMLFFFLLNKLPVHNSTCKCALICLLSMGIAIPSYLG